MLNLTAERLEIPIPDNSSAAVLVDDEGNPWAYCTKWRYAQMLEIDHKTRRILPEVVKEFDKILLNGGIASVGDERRIKALRDKVARLERGEG